MPQAPGANVNSNGPITGIPQYRGMYGPRIATSLDGNQLAPAGPNWMAPPISYAVSAQLESLEIYRGLAPVSVARGWYRASERIMSPRLYYSSVPNTSVPLPRPPGPAATLPTPISLRLLL